MEIIPALSHDLIMVIISYTDNWVCMVGLVCVPPSYQLGVCVCVCVSVCYTAGLSTIELCIVCVCVCVYVCIS